MRWYSRVCPVCGGDGHDDPEDSTAILCMMCGRSIPMTESREAPSGQRGSPLGGLPGTGRASVHPRGSRSGVVPPHSSALRLAES
jgi:hypothetical protein